MDRHVVRQGESVGFSVFRSCRRQGEKSSMGWPMASEVEFSDS